jgi:hypothetical protein
MPKNEREPSCATCIYWQKRGPLGDCRRRAPGDIDYWPETTEDDWCGDWTTRSGDTLPALRLREIRPANPFDRLQRP